jgi:hypothetical protein
VKGAHVLAKLNGRILNIFSQRTAAALRLALPLPLRLALPQLESILALNVGKEVRKDTLVILHACEHAGGKPPHWNHLLPQLLNRAKEIDQAFLSRVGSFPIGIVIRYEELAPIRSQRIKLLYEAARRIRCARDGQRRLRDAIQASFSQDELAQLLDHLFALYADETRFVSRAVQLPLFLIPLREFIAQELFKIMIRVAKPLALEIAAAAYRPTLSSRGDHPETDSAPLTALDGFRD